jgi:hypothetical protein
VNKNDGSFLETLVQVIEQSLMPDAVVERNVQLPILNSGTGETAQCDIVIRTGSKPRQTVTIVEVQDRNRAVEINDFRGWLSKMNAVGAQHLYCVSRKEFPRSIKEQAALTGHTVKLIPLKEIDVAAIPLNFFKYTFLFHDIDIPSIKKNEVILDPDEIKRLGMSIDKIEPDINNLQTNDKQFSWDKMFLNALSTFCIANTPADNNRPEGTGNLSLGYEDNKPLYFYSHGIFVSMKLKIEYTWTFKKNTIRTVILSYDQDQYGALAWVLESFYQSPRGPICFRCLW